MSHVSHFLRDFLQREEGPTAVEYAVMLMLIVVVCLAAITALGTNANEVFGNVSLNVAASGGSDVTGGGSGVAGSLP